MLVTHFIFLTTEGHTFQPGVGETLEVENCQFLGIAGGESAKEAFYRLVEEERWLLETSFDKVFCYPLGERYREGKGWFCLDDVREDRKT